MTTPALAPGPTKFPSGVEYPSRVWICGVRTQVGSVKDRGYVGHSVGRVAIPVGSRPASSQPIMVAATGMATTMRNRLNHGT